MPHLLSSSFIFLVAILYSAFVVGALYADNRVEKDSRWTIRVLRFGLGGFLLLTGIAALDGNFLDFSSQPPKVAFAIAPAFIGMLVIAFHPRMKRWLSHLRQSWLIGIQTFRIVVEVQFIFLAKTLYFPTLMTFEGQNFDIVTGLTAPIIGWLVWMAEKKGTLAQMKPLIIVWNIMGIALVTNALVHGLLSAPTTFQYFQVDPPNTVIAYFPFIWLPTFVVPFAYLMHILSLRKVFSA